MERLTSFARCVRFDKRGTGLSDRPPGIPTLEERMEDAHAVMDAAELERGAIFGWSEGGPMSILFAATYPHRTTALILYGTKPCFVRAPDYDWGISPEAMESSISQLEAAWGRVPMVHLAPTGNERYRSWLLRYQQAAASPARAYRSLGGSFAWLHRRSVEAVSRRGRKGSHLDQPVTNWVLKSD